MVESPELTSLVIVLPEKVTDVVVEVVVISLENCGAPTEVDIRDEADVVNELRAVVEDVSVNCDTGVN